MASVGKILKNRLIFLKGGILSERCKTDPFSQQAHVIHHNNKIAWPRDG
jgi:hypothetical protein